MKALSNGLAFLILGAVFVVLPWLFFAPLLPHWLRLPWIGQADGVAWFAPLLWIAAFWLLNRFRWRPDPTRPDQRR